MITLARARGYELLSGPNLQVYLETNLLILNQDGVASLFHDQIDRAR
jgi:hypothetical protein